ncbi:hypothetical protein [Actinobaculum sp. 313]|uniref:peptidoglycan-binding domain-containing protein n=1 Tax=Actinobaculum sp. 313 TaxID=2495645 RepID=UPI000D525C54|nr:hypothetical protein [Actinobaculum sp. 313]AWE42528.1 hypothetical protein DDD63_06935 [Actinobaculum sp. 313]
MMNNGHTRILWGLIGLACGIGLGVAAGVTFLSPAVPTSLATPEPVTSVPVTEREYADQHTVELAFTATSGSEIMAPADGRVTASTCSPGNTLDSGTATFFIDGKALISLATSQPLWRDLHLGDSGADVRALQEELVRLGYSSSTSGVLDANTLAGFNYIVRGIDPTEKNLESIELSRILWIPAPQVTVASCEVSVGGNARAGEPLATLPISAQEAHILQLPTNASPGARVVVIDGEEIPVDEKGRISDPAVLQRFAATSSFTTAVSSETPTISASYRLATPTSVLVVPPGALYDVAGEQACVVGDGEPIAVEIRGSELGESFVQLVGDAPTTPSEVAADPKGSPACR